MLGLDVCSVIERPLGDIMSGNGTDHTCPNTKLVWYSDVHCTKMVSNSDSENPLKNAVYKRPKTEGIQIRMLRKLETENL